MKRDRQRVDYICEGDNGHVPGWKDQSDIIHLSETCTKILLSCRAANYSTFSDIKEVVKQRGHDRQHRILYNLFRHARRHQAGKFERRKFESSMDQNYLTTRTLSIVIFLSLTIAMVAYVRDTIRNSRHNAFMDAEWHWDHNVYIGKDNVDNSPGEVVVSLIAQVIPGTTLSRLGDISSRPNRAYARQWGLDFARYDTGLSSYNPRACFEKVFALNAILDKQSNSTGDLMSMWSHYPRVQYDFILLLPPDSILTELDTDIIKTLLPRRKLAAIAGWNRHHKLVSNSDVVVFNLKHQHAKAVARLWLELVSLPQVTCGASNDLGMLVDAIAAVMDEYEDLDELIEPLPENEAGVIGNGVIKNIPSTVPGPRMTLLSSSIEESAGILQQTADSVCYRFYPKCEVLTPTY